jgi:hypothetical protein
VKITIESTSEFVEIEPQGSGTVVPARVWQGTTEGGVKIQVLVTRIGASADEDLRQFEKELREVSPPIAGMPRIFPLRLIL